MKAWAGTHGPKGRKGEFMFYNLTMKEKREAKRMGYTHVGWYKRRNGVPFHQFFTSERRLNDFTGGVIQAGGQLMAAKEV